MLQVTAAQLEPSAISTGFIVEKETTVLDVCQGWYQKSYDQSEAAGDATNKGKERAAASGTDSTQLQFDFLKTLSRSPNSVDITIYSTTGSSAVIRNTTAGSDIAVTLDEISDTGIVLDATMIDQNMYQWHWTVDID